MLKEPRTAAPRKAYEEPGARTSEPLPSTVSLELRTCDKVDEGARMVPFQHPVRSGDSCPAKTAEEWSAIEKKRRSAQETGF